MQAQAALAAAVVMLATACGASNIRPSYAPFAEALSDTVAAEPDAVIRNVMALVAAERLPVRHASAAEGYLETDWFHAPTKERRGAYSLGDDVVRLRFWADEVRRTRTLVVGEAVYRRVIDPSLPPRIAEAPVAPAHAGHEILRRVLDSLRTRLGR